MHPKPRIAVIGAGPSGLTALKNLLDQQLDVVCLEAAAQVGGNWVYSESESHSSVFETTHIISSRSLSEYGDLPWSVSNPQVADYPSHRELAAYFADYARRFGLHEHIRFNTRVLKAERQGPGQWTLELEGPGGKTRESFTHLVVCNGHHWDPRMPAYPGHFSGEMLHSHQYKKAAPFAGKRVLVIGGGNSACDVAVETSRVSTRTDISWRRGYRIVPKFVFGKPTDVFASGSSWMPIKLRTRLSAAILRLLIGDNELYGLQKPDHKFSETHPTVNDELLYRIRHGKVHPRVDIERMEGKTVYFKDGSSAEYDSIIACTGFKISHPFFDPSFLNYSEGPVPLYLKMLHPDYPDLYFIGLFQPLGCIWPLAELQAKIAAREIAGLWKRPADLSMRIQAQLNNPHYRQIDTPRHTITVDYHAFRRELLRELPADWKSPAGPAQSSSSSPPSSDESASRVSSSSSLSSSTSASSTATSPSASGVTPPLSTS
jgi:hypothetical protein